ncbi:hypothetical protein [Agitococcus lubricus]|uniref:Uncharacterized protein n=1 Tax=Agitococcus lubricus TaxID=1077255 RepID=A0A2T5IYF5_9GAMM|nr:hypothetical protein [Agitococcus lubricus]PTQ89029.1 hypothetical protein C8N29_10950 [Agitococcus lubricus]
MKKLTISILCTALLSACVQMPNSDSAGSTPRPAFKDSAIGLATVGSLIILMDVKRQKTQETLKTQTSSQGISKYQARLSAIDAVKSNLVSYSSGQLSLGDKISLVNATSDIVKSKLPDYGDIIATLSTLSQVLITAQHQAKAAAAAANQ